MTGLLSFWLRLLALQHSLAHPSAPRVALLFVTKGPMPLERAWRLFFRGVRGLAPPHLTEYQRSAILEGSITEELSASLRAVGALKENSLVQDAPCVSNELFLARTPDPLMLACTCRLHAMQTCQRSIHHRNRGALISVALLQARGNSVRCLRHRAVTHASGLVPMPNGGTCMPIRTPVR